MLIKKFFQPSTFPLLASWLGCSWSSREVSVLETPRSLISIHTVIYLSTYYYISKNLCMHINFLPWEMISLCLKKRV